MTRREWLRAVLRGARLKKKLKQTDVAWMLNKNATWTNRFEIGKVQQLDILDFIDLAEMLDEDPVKLVRQLRRIPWRVTP